LLARVIEDARESGGTMIAGTTVRGTEAAAMHARLGVTSRFFVRTFAMSF
jgi:hypothetical protein